VTAAALAQRWRRAEAELRRRPVRICLSSGGLDSSAVLSLAAVDLGLDVAPLYIKRGAAAEAHEIAALHAVIDHLNTAASGRIHDVAFVDCLYPPPDLKARLPRALSDRVGHPGREVVLAHAAIYHALASYPGIAPDDVVILGGSLAGDIFPHNSIDYWDAVNQLLTIEFGGASPLVINPWLEGALGVAAGKREVLAFLAARAFPVHIARTCVSASREPCGVCLECRQRAEAEEAL
jgi:7-cyano-7-deazaguanine synthase in queuosine biosynthesis